MAPLRGQPHGRPLSSPKRTQRTTQPQCWRTSLFPATGILNLDSAPRTGRIVAKVTGLDNENVIGATGGALELLSDELTLRNGDGAEITWGGRDFTATEGNAVNRSAKARLIPAGATEALPSKIPTLLEDLTVAFTSTPTHASFDTTSPITFTAGGNKSEFKSLLYNDEVINAAPEAFVFTLTAPSKTAYGNGVVRIGTVGATQTITWNNEDKAQFAVMEPATPHHGAEGGDGRGARHSDLQPRPDRQPDDRAGGEIQYRRHSADKREEHRRAGG